MIKYPGGKTYTKPTTKQSTSKRGMDLEHDLNLSNEFYRETDKAVIYKKPTPVQVVTVDYKSRSTAKITEAYYKLPSTVDYSGIYKGYHIEFEAKETHSKTSFPLSSIHKHQINYLEQVIRHGGIGFVIIRFVAHDKTYYVEGDKIIGIYRNSSRRSIPFSWFEENAMEIPYGLNPRVDYLSCVDQMIIEEDSNG